jgi:hypothetical protein
MGLNRPAFDIKGAYTFLSKATGTEVSATAGVTFNLRSLASAMRLARRSELPRPSLPLAIAAR